MLITILAYLGGVFLFLAAVAVLAGAWSLLADALAARRAAVFEEAAEHHGARLRELSWWFSEDEATMRAIQGLADRRDIGDVRDEWRRARAKTERQP